MKTLMIVARDSMLTELEDLLHKNGINAYSVINKVEGSGKTGKVGAFHHKCVYRLHALQSDDPCGASVRPSGESGRRPESVSHSPQEASKRRTYPPEAICFSL